MVGQPADKLFDIWLGEEVFLSMMAPEGWSHRGYDHHYLTASG